jgi:hypothetical protein
LAHDSAVSNAHIVVRSTRMAASLLRTEETLWTGSSLSTSN